MHAAKEYAGNRTADDYAFFRTSMTVPVRHTSQSLAQDGILPPVPPVGLSYVDGLALQRLVSLSAYAMSFLPYSVYTEDTFSKTAEGGHKLAMLMCLLLYICIFMTCTITLLAAAIRLTLSSAHRGLDAIYANSMREDAAFANMLNELESQGVPGGVDLKKDPQTWKEPFKSIPNRAAYLVKAPTPAFWVQDAFRAPSSRCSFVWEDDSNGAEEGAITDDAFEDFKSLVSITCLCFRMKRPGLFSFVTCLFRFVGVLQPSHEVPSCTCALFLRL